MTLTLGALLGQYMTAMRLVSLEAASSFLEPLGCTSIGLYLWHFLSPVARRLSKNRLIYCGQA